MTQVEQLAAFVAWTTYEELSEDACQALKIRVLDSPGCSIAALYGPPIGMIRTQLEDFGGKPLVMLIEDGKNAPDRAAFYNAALVHYLDYNDSYLAKGETCHPSDNLGAVLEAVRRETNEEMPCRIRIVLKNGQTFSAEKQDYARSGYSMLIIVKWFSLNAYALAFGSPNACGGVS
jgi:2-methylcitrate dehydratase PrpD